MYSSHTHTYTHAHAPPPKANIAMVSLFRSKGGGSTPHRKKGERGKKKDIKKSTIHSYHTYFLYPLPT